MVITVLTLVICFAFTVLQIRSWNQKCTEAHKRFVSGAVDMNTARGVHSRVR